MCAALATLYLLQIVMNFCITVNRHTTDLRIENENIYNITELIKINSPVIIL